MSNTERRAPGYDAVLKHKPGAAPKPMRSEGTGHVPGKKIPTSVMGERKKTRSDAGDSPADWMTS